MKLVISWKNAYDQTEKVINLVSLLINATGYEMVIGLDDVNLDPFEDM